MPLPMTDTPAAASRPVVKLRPGKGRRLREGAPWVYADEIAMDRRTRALVPGSLVRLVEPNRDGEDRPLGLFAFNAESQIAARFLDPDPEAEIGPDWFAAKLRRARLLRCDPETGAPQRYCRLVHAEGDGLPGLVIDLYGAAAVIQPNAAWADRLLDAILAALLALEGLEIEAVVVNAASRVRALEGLGSHVTVVHGAVEGPVEVEMNGALYLADLLGGQKTGLFFDQRANHAAVAGLRPRAVLDVFSHVGGFGLACLAGGAERVVAVDSSAPALALAEAAARRAGRAARYETRRADAFEAMAASAAAGERFAMVVCDPPAFAPHKGALEAGLRAYEKTARLAARLVEPDGWLVLCSCSGAVTAEALREASVRGIRVAGRTGALVQSGRASPDHPQHMALPETGYLKALFFRLE